MSSPPALPIFPLNTVLFPGGLLPLRVFEARYMDMARECLRTGAPFGVCLIREGREVGEAAVPQDIGCAAHIIECDMQQLGVLTLKCRGGDRFRILERAVTPQGLVRAAVEWLEPEEDAAIPPNLMGCVKLLRIVAADERFPAFATEPRYESASWVGHRVSEILPIPLRVKQQLLELDASLPRLQILQDFLEKHGLLSK